MYIFNAMTFAKFRGFFQFTPLPSASHCQSIHSEPIEEHTHNSSGSNFDDNAAAIRHGVKRSLPYPKQSLPENTLRCRKILVEWLVKVAERLFVSLEATARAVQLLDWMLCLKDDTDKSKLQLLGVVCLMIAGKYDDMYPPDISDYQRVCDHAYRKKDFIAMEHHVLKSLNWNISIPTWCYFLDGNGYMTGRGKSINVLNLDRTSGNRNSPGFALLSQHALDFDALKHGAYTTFFRLRCNLLDDGLPAVSRGNCTGCIVSYV